MFDVITLSSRRPLMRSNQCNQCTSMFYIPKVAHCIYVNSLTPSNSFSAVHFFFWSKTFQMLLICPCQIWLSQIKPPVSYRKPSALPCKWYRINFSKLRRMKVLMSSQLPRDSNRPKSTHVMDVHADSLSASDQQGDRGIGDWFLNGWSNKL